VSGEGRFAGRRAIVTGAGGFIGSALCRSLAAEGAETVGAEIDEGTRTAVEAAGASFVACDVRDPVATAAMVEAADLVFHTAALIHEGGRMEEFVDLNLRGTINVIERAGEAGVERVVHLSSVVVYGYEDPSTQGEDAPLRTYGIPYLDTKSSSDRIARRRGAVVIRAGDVYGPGSVPWTLRPLQLAAEGRMAIPSPGDGRMLPVYVDDLVEAALLGALRGEAGRAYTAWSGEEISFGDYFDRLLAPTGGRCRRLPAAVLRVAARAASAIPSGGGPELGPDALVFVDRRGSVSNRRIREELGWEPRTTLREGLAKVAGDGAGPGGNWAPTVTRASAGPGT
jgi:nucleoside-diphosphate-sugar epimerase